MRSIKNFFHDINDIILALLIVVIATGIIFWRMQVILRYPDKIVSGEIPTVEQDIDEAEPVDEAEQEAIDSVDADEAQEEPRG